MDDSDKKMFKEIVENIFVRWTALKLAVEHGQGGKSGQQVRKFVCRPNQTFSLEHFFLLFSSDCIGSLKLCVRVLHWKRQCDTVRDSRTFRRHFG